MDPEDDEEHPTNLFGTMSNSPSNSLIAKYYFQFSTIVTYLLMIVDESMLCPESPFTPKSHSVAAPERKPNSIKSVVRESPEVAKSGI